ncbi:uncharacterized protein LY79DRAFT_503652 [Colletotrichum navitas]|uniref:Uncharacterized protein n=1 Tax=Colletotrichum navitas TaxID=681940 RepID=A0AAD8VCB3_9PEZI|nr:uncharacterized protein LY79DRAFT_503652 [Colletotrichum navitas]KAK1599928.1 hypothetical protein LY79DRAFT_503652 [Colletotrichum navitas]
MEAPDAPRPSSTSDSLVTGPDLPARLTDATPGTTANAALFALARFEFETGKGNEGTKILMVEWDPSASPSVLTLPSATSKAWEVSWEGKTNYLPASDEVTGTNKRVYFLLPPGATVPPVVTISHPDGTRLTTKPLPAIFPPGLAAGNPDVGMRGILHTIWAKKRLSGLQEEVEIEMKTNTESVGLEMALQERQWITCHFGVALKPDVVQHATMFASRTPPSPVSSKAPVAGRLGEKIKVLKLATSAADLVAGSAGTDTDPMSADESAHVHTTSFSPTSSDIAVSSFSSFIRPTTPGNPAVEGSVSLDAVSSKSAFSSKQQDQDQEEGLFALSMSPRSPEMKRSPFSLA